MYFAMLPKYYIGQFPPICSILAIFAHKSHYDSFLHRVFVNPTCYFAYDYLTQILCTVPYDMQPAATTAQVVRNIQTTPKSSQETGL